MSTFISYSQQDAAVAEAIQRAMVRNNVKFWRDSAKLLAGDHLSPQIFAAIEASSSYVILVSAASMSSEWVERELELAADLEQLGRLVIVAVRLDDTPIPAALADKLYVDLRGSETDEGVRPLIVALRAVDEPAPPVGRSGTSPRTFTDHGIEVGRTPEGGFLMQLDIVSFDTDEKYTVLTQFVFSSDRPVGGEHDDRAQVDQLLITCASEFEQHPARITLKSGDVERWTMTVVDEGADTVTIRARVRRLGLQTRGTLLFNVGALFTQICETYGLETGMNRDGSGSGSDS